jgi:hypothetical protein
VRRLLRKSKGNFWDTAPPGKRLGFAVFGICLCVLLGLWAVVDLDGLLDTPRGWILIPVLPLVLAFFVYEAIRAQNDEDNE